MGDHGRRVLRLHPAHHQQPRRADPRAVPGPKAVPDPRAAGSGRLHARAFFRIADAQPAGSGTHQHRGAKLRAMTIGIGLDYSQDFDLRARHRLHRTQIFSQPRP